jgi:hypothetical protein
MKFEHVPLLRLLQAKILRFQFICIIVYNAEFEAKITTRITSYTIRLHHIVSHHIIVHAYYVYVFDRNFCFSLHKRMMNAVSE